ncbi:MAG: DMT family transporter [Lachnospiraceae bacterium]|nr:DMT family transporter [Lachnospiraceae bacterium]
MNQARLKYISAMLIFGSVGLFVRYIPLPSSGIALGRGIIGCLFLLLMMFILRKRISFKRVRADLIILILSGAAIGINWIFLFEAYRYTTIANATICYYLAPVIVVFLSPFILKEKLTFIKVCCILAAITGIILITGIGEEQGANDLKGIIYGLGAALFYASVIILNKFFRHVTDFERTVIQLFFASASLLPYVALTYPSDGQAIEITGVILLLTVGIIHTGFAYFLYFSGLNALKGQTAALLSYIDPLTAIILSTVILSEKMGILQVVGGFLILGGTMLNEIFSEKKPKDMSF